MLFTLSQILDHIYCVECELRSIQLAEIVCDGHEMSNNFICHLITSRFDVIEIDLNECIEYLRPIAVIVVNDDPIQISIETLLR